MSRPATPHAAHDELLIARLFGADVDDRERTLAQEQIAGCEDCAALFADLGSIARRLRSPHWIFRQHIGVANGPLWRSEFP